MIARAAAAGVGHVIVIAESLAASARAAELAGEFRLSATAGVHPHDATQWNADAAARVGALLDDPQVVAVGETGLDYHYDYSPREQQREAFEAQLGLAADRGKPIVVHAREADEAMVAVLAAWRGRVPSLILHSFSSGPTVFEAGLAAGAYFGFSGMVTFRNWTLGDCVRACPEDRLLVETDAPYLAPVPHRGKRNEPSFVRVVAERIAGIRGVSVDALIAQTTANAVRCFGARVAPSLERP